jgi:hypothetical protein
LARSIAPLESILRAKTGKERVASDFRPWQAHASSPDDESRKEVSMDREETKSSGRSLWMMIGVALLATLFAFWFVRGRR